MPLRPNSSVFHTAVLSIRALMDKISEFLRPKIQAADHD